MVSSPNRSPTTSASIIDGMPASSTATCSGTPFPRTNVPNANAMAGATRSRNAVSAASGTTARPIARGRSESPTESRIHGATMFASNPNPLFTGSGIANGRASNANPSAMTAGNVNSSLRGFTRASSLDP